MNCVRNYVRPLLAEHSAVSSRLRPTTIGVQPLGRRDDLLKGIQELQDDDDPAENLDRPWPPRHENARTR